MSEEKTEQPTEKRLRDAREEGEVAKSQDLTGALTLLITATTLIVMRHSLTDATQGMVRGALRHVSGELSMQNIFVTLQQILHGGLFLVLPITLAATIGAIAALLPQVGVCISLDPVLPKLDSLNPANGLKRIFSVKSLMEFARMLLKAILISVVMWKSGELILPFIAGSAEQSFDTLLQVAWFSVVKFMAIAIVMFVIIGALDWKFQRWHFIREHRMSKDEIKREYKEMEGDPHVKSTRKKLAKEIAFSPGMNRSVAASNVLVVNPTHYAVAIRYVPDEHPLPRVIAKGADDVAAALRRLAQQAGVPIVGNPPVARALFSVPLQEGIPEEMFEAVATILRWINEIGDQREPGAYVVPSPE